jgi:AcrR family transcriptional regulator
MTDVVFGADGRTLSARGVETRTRLIEAAEEVFGELGYHDTTMPRS